MRILYSLSVILLIVCFLLAKKSDNKLNILKWILISIVVFSGFNAFSAFLVSIVHVKASLLSRLIINLMASGVIYYYFLRKKEFQKYYYKWTDIIAFVIITIVCSIVVGIRTHGFDLYFETTDPATHTLVAERFVESNRISVDNPNVDKLYNTQKSYDLFFSYVNLGTMFQVFGTTQGSHVLLFYIFEYLTLITSIFSFYLLISKSNNKILNLIISLIISIVYMLGYPLNNLIFGFHYLGLSILITSMIILIYEELFESNLKNSLMVLLSAWLLNFSLFTSYYLFIPIVYGGIGVYILWKVFINKEIDLKKAIYIIGVTLVIPFVLGMYMYFIYPRFALPNSESAASAFAMNGYIYRNLVGNFLILFPIVIYSSIKCIKNKKIDPETFMLPILLIFMAYIMKLMYARVAETYYYYKFYFMLALFMYLCIGRLFNRSDESSGIVGSYILCYCLLLIAMFFNIDTILTEKYILINPVPSIDNAVHIYKTNKNYINDAEVIFTRSQLESLDKINDLKLLKTGNVCYFGGLFQKLWVYSLYRISPVLDEYRLGNYYDEEPTLEDAFNDEDIKYILVNKSSEMSKQASKIYNDEKSDKKLFIKYKDKNFILYEVIKNHN